MRAALTALTITALASCGGAARDHTDGPDEIADDGPPPLAEAEAPRASGRPYADTPLTPIADDLTALALAAISGAPLPVTRAPLDAPLESPLEIDWQSTAPRDPVVLGIAFEIELILKRGAPDDDAVGPDRWGSIRLTLALSRHGLRLVSLRPRTMSHALPGGSLPPPMRGATAVAAELLGAIRAGDVTGYAMGEDERRLLDNDEVWLQAQQDRVSPEMVRQVQQMIATLPDEPLAWRLDDIAVLIADADDRLLSLAFEWDADGQGSFALRTSPLIEVRQLWPLRVNQPLPL